MWAGRWDFHSVVLICCHHVTATHLDRCVFLKDKNTDKRRAGQRARTKYVLFVFNRMTCPCIAQRETAEPVVLLESQLWFMNWHIEVCIRITVVFLMFYLWSIWKYSNIVFLIQKRVLENDTRWALELKTSIFLFRVSKDLLYFTH